MDPNAVGVTLGVELIKRTAPSGIAWLTTFAKGIELLILGPGNSGKTTFADYLRFGMLESEAKHIKTIDIKKSSTFSLGMGRDEALKLRLRRSVDVPGQIGPTAHAQLVKERRPHAVILLLDCGRTQSGIVKWLDEFFEQIDQLFIDDPRLKRKIKTIKIILNKRDKIGRQSDYTKLEKAVRQSVLDGISNSLGKSAAKKMQILPCVSVETKKYGSKLIDVVIKKIAKSVSQG